ncbi:TNFAIP3-interacting protein 1-like [Dunckerocampus dactyliophorus]|uniref:TNFAIP3-interacting protein 1-like n=1 Tax=Dunckerocampus dactyliophorus TaxID=161453 RepID=UPI00240716D0|nr:TNFAIP3-interacting protein 1-like [Dunckerocampus dactyliophorus]
MSGAANTDTSMQAKIFILERQRQELLTINERWAKEYRTMVAHYQQKLLSLQTSLQDGNNVGTKTCEAVKEKENSQATNSDVHAELLNAVTKANELQMQNSALTRRGQHQREEIHRLNKALEERLQPARPFEDSNGPPLDVWKHQAEVFKEDFLKERGDREKLQHKYVELEKKLTKAHDELHHLKSQATWTRLLRPVVDCACKHAEQRQTRTQKRQHP